MEARSCGDGRSEFTGASTVGPQPQSGSFVGGGFVVAI